MRFGARLKLLREKAGMTQGELAKSAGLSQAGISDLEQERGNRKPTWETVQKLADALGVTCLEFREDDEPEVKKAGRGRPKKS